MSRRYPLPSRAAGLLLIFPALCSVRAEVPAAGDALIEAPVKNTLTLRAPEPEQPGPYLSGVWGSGLTSTAGNQRWRTFELRIGLPVDKLPEARLDIIYYNEGHPVDNHRDGFALQGVLGKRLGARGKLELGAGPYFSMNTTVADDTEHVEKRLGALVSAAALYTFSSSGYHLRLGLNQACVIDGPFSTALMAGVGKNFDSLQSASSPSAIVPPGVEAAVLGGLYQTNQHHIQESWGYQLELKKHIDPRWALSLIWLEEGDDRQLVDRRGAAVTAWYRIPLGVYWAASAGVGPYLAHNRYASEALECDGLAFLQFDRGLGRQWKVIGRFGRIITGDTDRDIFLLGISRMIGREA